MSIYRAGQWRRGGIRGQEGHEVDTRRDTKRKVRQEHRHTKCDTSENKKRDTSKDTSEHNSSSLLLVIF